MAAKKKGLTINIGPDEVMYTNISKSKDGYNSARIVVKRGDKEYMSISYEWEGEGVPAFAMDLMGFMQANEITPNTVIDEKAYTEYEECASRRNNKKLKKEKGKKEDSDLEDE
jgi:hypothetical protein